MSSVENFSESLLENAEGKPLLYNVIRDFVIPQPIRLGHELNLKLIQNIVKSTKNNQLSNEKIIHLKEMAIGERSLNPISYYVIYSKSKKLNRKQFRKIFAQISPIEKKLMLVKLLELHPAISGLTYDKKEMITTAIKNKADNKQLTSLFLELPIEVQRLAISLCNESTKSLIKEQFTNNLSDTIDGLDYKQTKKFLAGLLHRHIENHQVRVVHLTLALDKYGDKLCKKMIKKFDKRLIEEQLNRFLDKQLRYESPNIVVIFTRYGNDEVIKYSRIIEDAAKDKKTSLNPDDEMRNFFESMVCFNTNCATKIATIGASKQARVAVPLTTKIDVNGDVVANPRLTVIDYDQDKDSILVTDIGDYNNSLSTSKNNKNEYEIFVNTVDMRDAMHRFCHSLHLNHLDEMFYSDKQLEELKERKQKKIKVMEKLALNIDPSREYNTLGVFNNSLESTENNRGRT